MSRMIVCLAALWSLATIATAAEKPIDTPAQAAKRLELIGKFKEIEKKFQEIPVPPPPSSTRSAPSVDSGQSSAERRALENLDKQESLRVNERILEKVQ